MLGLAPAACVLYVFSWFVWELIHKPPVFLHLALGEFNTSHQQLCWWWLWVPSLQNKWQEFLGLVVLMEIQSFGRGERLLYPIFEICQPFLGAFRPKFIFFTDPTGFRRTLPFQNT